MPTMTTRTIMAKTVAAAVTFGAFLSGCGDLATLPGATPTPGQTASTPNQTASPTPLPAGQPAAAGDAAAALATLPIKGRAPKTGYDREDQFGAAWADVDRNGCDTRNDILARDLTNITYRDNDGCTIATGTLNDPYTGTTIQFVRGQTTSSAVQIDHVVALSDAWQKGAQQISADQRKQLANDPLNLLAVDGPTNAKKGDGDAATWLPPNKAFRCDYVARQVAVKQRYNLWVTEAERDAIANILTTCPGQPLPR